MSTRAFRQLLPIFLLSACASVTAQNPQVEARPKPAFPTVTFSWAYWHATPPQYTLSITSAGSATYQSIPRPVARTGDPYTVQFPVSKRMRQEIFDLVQRLNFLDIPSNDRRLSAGKESVKTISFRQGETHHQIIYQKTNNLRVQELASIFEGISTTLEFGRRLAELHQQHAARLSGELERMHTLVARGGLPEVQSIANVLHAIASDRSLSGKVRQQAEAILKRTD